MMAISAAVIGLGFIGASGHPGKTAISHAGAICEHPEVHLIAGVDPDLDRQKTFSCTWGVERVFSDCQQMFSKCTPQLVVICVPTQLHYDIAKEVIDAGVRLVIIEKPVAEKLEQVDELIRLASKSRATVAVNHGRAWDENTREMIFRLRQGALGEIKSINVIFTGGIVHNGTHMFQIANEILGQPLAVTASQDSSGVAIGTVEYQDQRRAVFTSLQNHNYSLHELDFVTTSGRCRYLCGGERIEYHDTRESEFFPSFYVLKPIRIAENPGLSGFMSSAISDLLKSARTGRRPCCGLPEGRQALAVALAFEKSCRNKGLRTIVDQLQTCKG